MKSYPHRRDGDVGHTYMEAHLNLRNQLTYHNCTRPHPLEGSIRGIAWAQERNLSNQDWIEPLTTKNG